jgi:ElaB/YqjD/DUF883 family membrane-anchored ribosome-binding protein
MNTSANTLADSLSASIADGANRVALRAEDTLQDTSRVAHQTAQKLGAGAQGLRAKTANTLSDAAAQAEELARRGLDRARDVAAQAREQASHLRDVTADRVQADPMKALLMAAAAGAATALLVRWLSNSRRGD